MLLLPCRVKTSTTSGNLMSLNPITTGSTAEWRDVIDSDMPSPFHVAWEKCEGIKNEF
jgi:hypothetical protein